MNLWARTARLVWIIPALLLFSCEDDLNTIGLDPENNLGIFFVEVPLKDRVSQVWVNDVGSIGFGNLLVGSQQFDGFGLVQARNFSQIGFNALDIEDSSVFDSLVLEMRVVDISGNNIGSNIQRLELFQLQEPVNTAATTFLTSTSQELGTMLGSRDLFVFSDSVDLNVAETALNPQDSADAATISRDYDDNGDYIYRHTIRLDDTFGEDFFVKKRDEASEFVNDSSFTAFFKGLALVPDDNNSTIITYDALNEFTRLSLYYTELMADGTRETKVIIFPISTENSYNNISPNINQPWVGSDFDEISEFYTPLQTSNENAYLQSGTNMFMHVDISDFDQFSDSVDTYIIQNAELIIKGLESVSTLNNPPSRLVYYLTSSDSLAAENYDVTFIPTDLQTANPVLGIYNPDENEYRISMPQFVQVATDSLDFSEIVIAPVNIVNSTLFVEGSSVEGFVVPKENMSIRFFYTIPEKN